MILSPIPIPRWLYLVSYLAQNLDIQMEDEFDECQVGRFLLANGTQAHVTHGLLYKDWFSMLFAPVKIDQSIIPSAPTTKASPCFRVPCNSSHHNHHLHHQKKWPTLYVFSWSCSLCQSSSERERENSCLYATCIHVHLHPLILLCVLWVFPVAITPDKT